MIIAAGLGEQQLLDVVDVAVRIVEAGGAVVIFVGAVIAFGRFIVVSVRREGMDPFAPVRLDLGRFLALGLEFQLAADILRTAVAPSFTQLAQLAAIAAIRTALNFFLGREIKEQRELVRADQSAAAQRMDGRAGPVDHRSRGADAGPGSGTASVAEPGLSIDVSRIGNRDDRHRPRRRPPQYRRRARRSRPGAGQDPADLFVAGPPARLLHRGQPAALGRSPGLANSRHRCPHHHHPPARRPQLARHPRPGPPEHQACKLATLEYSKERSSSLSKPPANVRSPTDGPEDQRSCHALSMSREQMIKHVLGDYGSDEVSGPIMNCKNNGVTPVTGRAKWSV